jgi:hypothetical protein
MPFSGRFCDIATQIRTLLYANLRQEAAPAPSIVAFFYGDTSVASLEFELVPHGSVDHRHDDLAVRIVFLEVFVAVPYYDLIDAAYVWL